MTSLILLVLSGTVFAKQLPTSQLTVTGPVPQLLIFSGAAKSEQSCGIDRKYGDLYSIGFINPDSKNRERIQLVFSREEQLKAFFSGQAVTLTSGSLYAISLSKFRYSNDLNKGSNDCKITVKLEDGVVSGTIEKCTLFPGYSYELNSTPVAEISGTFYCEDGTDDKRI